MKIITQYMLYTVSIQSRTGVNLLRDKPTSAFIKNYVGTGNQQKRINTHVASIIP